MQWRKVKPWMDYKGGCYFVASGESRAAPKEVQKWLERIGKGDWLGVFMVVRGQVHGSAWSLSFSQVWKEGAARLAYQLAQKWDRRGRKQLSAVKHQKWKQTLLNVLCREVRESLWERDIWAKTGEKWESEPWSYLEKHPGLPGPEAKENLVC